MTSLWNTLCFSICPCQWIWGDPHTNVLNSFIILWAFLWPFDKMFRAVTPVVASVPIKLLPGVRVNFSWTPVLLTRILRAVLKPHPIAEERNLTCVVRIWYNRFSKCVLLSIITENHVRSLITSIICRNNQIKVSWVRCKRTQWTMNHGEGKHRESRNVAISSWLQNWQ